MASKIAPRLQPKQAQRAWHLWCRGLDTFLIASKLSDEFPELGITEAAVFNSLWALREEVRTRRAA